MPLNEVKGNMYDWVTHTWNTVKGECPHGCSYCYMKRFGNQRPVRFDEKELKTDLGEGNFIFVGSSCDMWADQIEPDMILMTLNHCYKYDNRYLFQTKNTRGIYELRAHLPRKSVVCTTIESDFNYQPEMGDTPTPYERARWMRLLWQDGYHTMLTIEPIMDFVDVGGFCEMIHSFHPGTVNIGANTNHRVKLPEPKASSVLELAENLNHFTEVRLKPNLKRILVEQMPGKENHARPKPY